MKVFLVLIGVVFLVGSNDDHREVLAMETAHRVSHCPRDEKEWQKASKRLNCSDDVTSPKNRYHCLPIDNLSTLLEFCYNRTRAQVIKGLCMVYVERKNILNHYNCSMFEKGCPDNWYNSNEMYKFPACFEIEPYQNCFKVETSCQPTTRLLTEVLDTTVSTLHNETSNSPAVDTNDGIHNLFAILFGIYLIIQIGFLILISIVAWKKRQRMRERLGRKASTQNCEDNGLLENEDIESIEEEINRSGIDYILQELTVDQKTFPMIAQKLKIPQEILRWNIKDRRKFVRSTRAGKISVYSGRGMVIGCAEAGKTTLVKKLKGDKDLKTVSTSGIEIHAHVFKLSENDTTITTCVQEEKSKSVLNLTPTALDKSDERKRETSWPVKEEVIADQYNDTNQTQTEYIDKSNVSSRCSELDFHTNGAVNDQEEILSQPYKTNHNLTVPVKVSQDDEQLTTKSEKQSTTNSEEQSATKSKEQLTTKSEKKSHEKQEFELSDCIPSANENDLKMLSLLDFAGQSAYYACHHIFYSPRAFFILVVDMTKKLDSKATEACKKEDQDLIYGNWTYADYIRYWLGSIHTFSSKTAPVILVFSHAENKDAKDVQKYYLEICRCLPKELRIHLKKDLMFPVKKESNYNMEELKKCIATTVKSQSHWGENVPISWTTLESFFIKLQKQKKIFLFSDLLRAVQSAKDINIKNRDELITALTFFHETGVVLFRSETENIILDVQWFVDAFKCIILDEKHLDTSDENNCDLFEQLTNHGLLSTELLDELWKKHNIYEHKDSLIYHMKQLDMLAELPKGKWYVPCMNKQKYDEKYLDNCNVSSRLCFLFKYLPYIVYHRLIVACINTLEMQPWETAGKQRIFHTVTILSCKDLTHRMLIGICDIKGRTDTDTEYPYSIEVQANVTKPDEIDTKLTSKFRRHIYELLDELTRPFFSDESSFHVGYRCKLGPFGGKQEGQIIKEKEMSGSKFKCNKCQSVHQEDVDLYRRFWKVINVEILLCNAVFKKQNMYLL
ncbi:uncharacterized protein LOC144622140 [Crassostrea virginica]